MSCRKSFRKLFSSDTLNERSNYLTQFKDGKFYFYSYYVNLFNIYNVYTCSLKIDCSVIILCCSSSHILWNRSFLSLISWSVFSSSLVKDVHWITISSIRRYSNIGWGAGWASPSRCGGTLMTSRCKLATLFLIVLKWLFKPCKKRCEKIMEFWKWHHTGLFGVG